jgi:hypothetical protein
VKVTQLIGAPITAHLEAGRDLRDPATLDALHREVAGAVQGLLDTARGRHPSPHTSR